MSLVTLAESMGFESVAGVPPDAVHPKEISLL